MQDGDVLPHFEAALQELQDEVVHLKSVEEEITGYAERALAETERLTKENEELRKAQEDANLDRCVHIRRIFFPRCNFTFICYDESV